MAEVLEEVHVLLQEQLGLDLVFLGSASSRCRISMVEAHGLQPRLEYGGNKQGEVFHGELGQNEVVEDFEFLEARHFWHKLTKE